MSVTNEMNRVKLSLASLPSGVPDLLMSQRQGDWYNRDTANEHFIIVKEMRDGQPQWKLLSTSLRGDYGGQSLFEFKAGPVYEAECGLRTVQGKRLTAEAYLASLKGVPSVELTREDGLLIVVALEFNIEHKQRLYETAHYACELDLETCTVTELETKIKVEIPMTTLNNVRYVSSVWSDGLQVCMFFKDTSVFDAMVSSQIEAVVHGETAELF